MEGIMQNVVTTLSAALYPFNTSLVTKQIYRTVKINKHLPVKCLTMDMIMEYDYQHGCGQGCSV
jgi:hypothetical protein